MMRVSLLTGFMLMGLAACSGAPDERPDPTESPYFAANDQMVVLEGQNVRYRTDGPVDAPTLVMLHGFSDSLHTWDALVEQLDEEFRILRPDLPGHALSGPAPDGDYSNEALVEFVDDFLEATDTENAILIGNSLGGLAAWRYAVSDPGTVDGLVLLAPGGVPYDQIGEEPQTVPMMLKLFLRSAPETGVRQMLKTLYADPTLVTDAQVTRYGDLMRVPGNGDAMVDRAAQFAFPAPEALMAQVQAPTIVIWGAQDAVLTPDQSDTFAANIPQVEVRLLDNVGHMPQAEATEQVVAAIRSLAEPSEQ